MVNRNQTVDDSVMSEFRGILPKSHTHTPVLWAMQLVGGCLDYELMVSSNLFNGGIPQLFRAITYRFSYLSTTHLLTFRTYHSSERLMNTMIERFRYTTIHFNKFHRCWNGSLCDLRKSLWIRPLPSHPHSCIPINAYTIPPAVFLNRSFIHVDVWG